MRALKRSRRRLKKGAREERCEGTLLSEALASSGVEEWMAHQITFWRRDRRRGAK